MVSIKRYTILVVLLQLIQVLCTILKKRLFTGCGDGEYKCVNSLGYEETMRCSDYKALCSASGFARPIPVQDGYKCFNGQEIEVSLCSLTAATPCTFGGTRCSNSLGEIVNNACTS